MRQFRKRVVRGSQRRPVRENPKLPAYLQYGKHAVGRTHGKPVYTDPVKLARWQAKRPAQWWPSEVGWFYPASDPWAGRPILERHSKTTRYAFNTDEELWALEDAPLEQQIAHAKRLFEVAQDDDARLEAEKLAEAEKVAAAKAEDQRKKAERVEQERIDATPDDQLTPEQLEGKRARQEARAVKRAEARARQERREELARKYGLDPSLPDIDDRLEAREAAEVEAERVAREQARIIEMAPKARSPGALATFLAEERREKQRQIEAARQVTTYTGIVPGTASEFVQKPMTAGGPQRQTAVIPGAEPPLSISGLAVMWDEGANKPIPSFDPETKTRYIAKFPMRLTFVVLSEESMLLTRATLQGKRIPASMVSVNIVDPNEWEDEDEDIDEDIDDEKEPLPPTALVRVEYAGIAEPRALTKEEAAKKGISEEQFEAGPIMTTPRMICTLCHGKLQVKNPAYEPLIFKLKKAEQVHANAQSKVRSYGNLRSARGVSAHILQEYNDAITRVSASWAKVQELKGQLASNPPILNCPSCKGQARGIRTLGDFVFRMDSTMWADYEMMEIFTPEKPSIDFLVDIEAMEVGEAIEASRQLWQLDDEQLVEVAEERGVPDFESLVLYEDELDEEGEETGELIVTVTDRDGLVDLIMQDIMQDLIAQQQEARGLAPAPAPKTVPLSPLMIAEAERLQRKRRGGRVAGERPAGERPASRQPATEPVPTQEQLMARMKPLPEGVQSIPVFVRETISATGSRALLIEGGQLFFANGLWSLHTYDGGVYNSAVLAKSGTNPKEIALLFDPPVANIRALGMRLTETTNATLDIPIFERL